MALRLSHENTKRKLNLLCYMATTRPKEGRGRRRNSWLLYPQKQKLRARHRQRQRVHERDCSELLRASRDRVHPLPSLSQERPGLGGAEEWRRRAPHDRLRRFEGLEAAAALARLYAAMRLFVNFFQPSFKLAAKARDGATVRKRYPPGYTLSVAVGAP